MPSALEHAQPHAGRSPTRPRTRRPRAVALRTSRWGERGPESVPLPSSAPRRYAARQHARATTRFGGRSSGARPRLTTPASLQHSQRPVVACDMELVARLPPEGVSLVGADLGRHAELAQEAEGAPRRRRAREVEVERDLAAATEVQAPGGVREAGELGEPVAVLRGTIPASSFRRSSDSDTFELQQPTLVLDSERAVRAEPVRRDDAMARDDEPEAVARAERAHSTLRVQAPGERRELAVGDRLAPTDPRIARVSASSNPVRPSRSIATSTKSSGAGEVAREPVASGSPLPRCSPPRAAARVQRAGPRRADLPHAPAPAPLADVRGGHRRNRRIKR